MARYGAAQGFDIGLTARRKDRLEALAKELTEIHNVSADIFPADLATSDGADRLLGALADTGRQVDLLVNNAGTSIPAGFATSNLADQNAFLQLTITTPVTLSHALLPTMLKKGWGRIINISSITALSSGGKGHTLYPAGKSFLLKFSQSLNAEVAEKGVFVTAVLPGFVKTEFQEAIGMADKMDGSTKRFAQTAEEVAIEAWKRNDRGVEIVVPGTLPKIGAACMRYFPERLMRALTRPSAEKYYIGD